MGAVLGALAVTTAAALGGCTPPEMPRATEAPSLAPAFASAFDAEALDPAAARPYLDAIDKAVANPAAPGALAVVIASVDALVLGATPELDLTRNYALAFRSRELLPEVVERLRSAWLSAGQHTGVEAMPFIRGMLAHGLHRLALYTGEWQPASVWIRRRGCVGEATILGPLDAMPLLGLEGPSPVQAVGAPLAVSYRGIAPFAGAIEPAVVRADTCVIDVNATSFLQGSRAVVVDLDNPKAQRVSFALTSPSAAVVDVGGVTVIRRGYEAGGSAVTRLSAVNLPAGRVRIVVRVAQKGDGSLIELDAWDEDGLPLGARAPRPGDVANVHAGDAIAVEITPRDGSDAEIALAAAALLGLGEGRAAEHLLEQGVPQAASGSSGALVGTSNPAKSGGTGRAARLDLLYSRALEAADDLPSAKVIERTRSAIAHALTAWPASWEARIGQARLTERRRGSGDGIIAALKELGINTPPSAGDRASARPLLPAADRLVLTYVALTARRMRLVDVAEAAYAELQRIAPDSPLLAEVDARLHGRIGADAVKAACSGGTSRAETACLEAHIERGDYKAAFSELARLRLLRSSADALRETEVHLRVANGDLAGALAAHDALAPAQRKLLEALGLAAGKGMLKPVKERMGEDILSARDTPYGIAPLVRMLGLEPDPAPPLESEGRKLVAQDRATAFLPGAATAVLRHLERYSIEVTGLIRYITYDLRRVSGTTDVAQGGYSFGPSIEGRGAPRLLRRRIHKRDGRVLEPDAAANASQQSDLSQLEQGDYVEQIVEGWALPGDSGQIVIDTPDLMPERTSVREAVIEVRRASVLPLALWAHPLLGKAEERHESGSVVSTWRLKDALPRRIEDGVPHMERGVGISMGTQTWSMVARAVAENVRSLEDRDPYITRFAQEIARAPETRPAAAPGAGVASPARALVERVVAAVGKRVKIASGAELSDISAVYSGGAQRTTARTILEMEQGSRSWVIYRVLRELKVPVDLAIAETEPFSASPDFPPHVGRFHHPLVVARLGGADGDLWIDADIEGPPLPPGRISPELRGRSAMLANGTIVTVQGTSGETGDEVDVRLVLDEKGDAQGTFTILLHGRAAQAIAEAFETVVGTDRREMLRSVVLAWVPWADVEDVTVSSTEGSWEIALRAAIQIHGYARPEGQDGKTWVLPGIEPVHIALPRFAGTLGATYASRGARQSALSIETPLQYHVRRRIELPQGASILRAPEPVRIDDARLDATRKGNYGPVIEEDFTLSLPTGTVPAEAYPSFVEKVRVIDDGFMAGTRVKVKP